MDLMGVPERLIKEEAAACHPLDAREYLIRYMVKLFPVLRG